MMVTTSTMNMTTFFFFFKSCTQVKFNCISNLLINFWSFDSVSWIRTDEINHSSVLVNSAADSGSVQSRTFSAWLPLREI